MFKPEDQTFHQPSSSAFNFPLVSPVSCWLLISGFYSVLGRTELLVSCPRHRIFCILGEKGGRGLHIG